MVIVGEDGPEVYSPGQSGHIIPNNQLGRNDNADVVRLLTELTRAVKENTTLIAEGNDELRRVRRNSDSVRLAGGLAGRAA